MVDYQEPDSNRGGSHSKGSDSRVVGGLTPQGRPRELEDWLNRTIYHPLSMRMAKVLAPTPVTPNTLSVVGGLMIVLAAFIYGVSTSWDSIACALVFHMSWHVFDGADGDLARLTGRSSSTGEVIDGICDYAGHIILYLVIAHFLVDDWGALAWLIAVASGAGRIVQAAHYEVQRRQYQYWVYATPWLRSTSAQMDQPKGIIGFFAAYYVGLAKLLAPGGREIDALVQTCANGELQKLRAVIKKETVPVLRSTYLLSANYRTLAVGVSMLAGSPIYFFAFEAIGLSIVLIISIAIAARAAQRIRDQAASTLR